MATEETKPTAAPHGGEKMLPHTSMPTLQEAQESFDTYRDLLAGWLRKMGHYKPDLTFENYEYASIPLTPANQKHFYREVWNNNTCTWVSQNCINQEDLTKEEELEKRIQENVPISVNFDNYWWRQHNTKYWSYIIRTNNNISFISIT